MEFVEGGTLHEYIQVSDFLQEDTIRRIIRQILSALEYMHERVRVSHRDLKPAVALSLYLTNYRTFFYAAEAQTLQLKLPISVSRRSRQLPKIIHSADLQDIWLQNALKVLKLQA